MNKIWQRSVRFLTDLFFIAFLFGSRYTPSVLGRLINVYMAIIAIDCDEVLVETMHTLCAYVKEVYNYDRDLEQFDSYHISENKHVGLDDNQVMKLFTDYYASEHAKSAGIPQGALDRLKAWKQAGHRLLVITARNDAWQQITDMQLERNFS